MSTKRNYSWQKQNNTVKAPTMFNQILSCVEYHRIPMNVEHIWDPRLKEKIKNDEIVVTEPETIADLVDLIPRNIKWKIEEDYTLGAQLLANHFNKRVVIVIADKSDGTQRKMNEGYHIPSGAGLFEMKQYNRAGKISVVFPKEAEAEAEAKSDDKTTKIRLEILPNKKHYIHTAEQNTKVVHSYCQCCQHSGSTGVSNTYGTGTKSSLKTKGRDSRKKLQFYHASNGETVFCK